MLEFEIDDDFAGARLDKFLKKRLASVPFSHLFKMIRVKKVRVNGKRAQPEQALVKGDKVTIRGDEKTLRGEGPRAPAPPPKVDLSVLEVVLEDDWILVINKPSGLAAHPGSGITGQTVVELVRGYLGPKAVRNDFAASPAHRLDRETSGLLVVAKRRPAMVHFTEVFTEHRAVKRYLAIVKGAMPQPSGVIDIALPEHQQTRESRERRGVNLQQARTRWRVVKQNDDYAFVECVLETGRTHQIRRHFAAIGHPLLGDDKHGDFQLNKQVRSKYGVKRLCLHSAHLEFPHPEDGVTVKLDAPLPKDLEGVLNALGIAPKKSVAAPA